MKNNKKGKDVLQYAKEDKLLWTNLDEGKTFMSGFYSWMVTWIVQNCSWLQEVDSTLIQGVLIFLEATTNYGNA